VLHEPDISGISCGFRAGTVLEAVAIYGAECESNHKGRLPTVLVISSFVLNLVEVVLLVQVGLASRGGATVPRPSARRCPGGWWRTTHAEFAEANRHRFRFPVRLVSAVMVSGLLCAAILLLIDFLAMETERCVWPRRGAIWPRCASLSS
jgi:hypothetical protein